MCPEYMACDTTFGVTKEQRSLFVIARIDGHNKVFTNMRYFMCSKETKAYHWAMKTELRHLVIDTTLSFNQCIACDQEISIYQPVREMMENIPCLDESCNRLDTYHLLT